LTFPGVGGYSRNLYNTTWNNFGPRGGFTYQWNNNTVLRRRIWQELSAFQYRLQRQRNGLQPASVDNAVNPIPFGLSPNGLPVGTFDQNSKHVCYCGTWC